MSALIFIRSVSVGRSLMHCTDTDARHVQDGDGKTLLTFDSSLGVWRDGKQIGCMQSRGDPSADPTWFFKPVASGEDYNTHVIVNGWHWRNLELAEVKVAEHLLGVQP